jgi:hypothetical protein
MGKPYERPFAERSLDSGEDPTGRLFTLRTPTKARSKGRYRRNYGEMGQECARTIGFEHIILSTLDTVENAAEACVHVVSDLLHLSVSDERKERSGVDGRNNRLSLELLYDHIARQ